MTKPTVLTRRLFLQATARLGGAVVLGSCVSTGRADEQVLVNHVGFVPSAAKYCMLSGSAAASFEVFNSGGQRVLQGSMQPVSGDLGGYRVGDFSTLREPGTYELRSAGARAGAFSIRDDVYADAIGKCIRYFARQRCGDSRSGFNAPCHLDDGVRTDNGQRLDVVGGWHDACDVRKWVSATVFGLVGLYRMLDVAGARPRADESDVIAELRWGNAYFHKMQAGDGSLMNYCGGDDGNDFTDNRPGTKDDRRVHVEPSELPEQFHFIAAQAALVRLTRDRDAAYARRCEEAARRCLTFCTTRRTPGAASSVAGAVIACVEMHRTFRDAASRDLAGRFLDQLVELQVTAAQSQSVHGFFRARPDEPQPYRDVMHGNLPLLALCEGCLHLADHPNHARWRESLRLHCACLAQMAGRSAFGIVPFGLYHGDDPGGGRRIGGYGYRWFMKTQNETSTPDWWVGINANLASTGVGLVRASRILADPKLLHLAQRQLDWILGTNPFDASTVTGVGRNQPKLFVTEEFKPPTPLIAGGVMNGIGGTAADEPALLPGSYHTCEYWTPMVAYTMWLMAELHERPKP